MPPATSGSHSALGAPSRGSATCWEPDSGRMAGRLKAKGSNSGFQGGSWGCNPLSAKVQGYSNSTGHLIVHHWGRLFLCAVPSSSSRSSSSRSSSSKWTRSHPKRPYPPVPTFSPDEQLQAISLSFWECKVIQWLRKTVWSFLNIFKMKLLLYVIIYDA